MLRMQFLNLWAEAVDGEGVEKQQSKRGAPKASYPGGEGTAQVWGRGTTGCQSVARRHTGTAVTVFQYFFLESWRGKEPWVLQPGSQFCKIFLTENRAEEGMRTLCNITDQTKDMLEGWERSWSIFTEYFYFSECYILHSWVCSIYSLATIPALHLTRNQSFPS